MNNFELAVELYWKKYEYILNRFYPAYDSTGFTERNLSINFASAIEEVCKGSFSWYEFPIGDKKEHLDVVIIDQGKKNIYLIESKRFSDLSKKLDSVASDVNRIVCKVDKRELLTRLQEVTNENIDTKLNEYTFYGVILVDVWRESASKIEIHETFRKFKRNEIDSDSEEYAKIFNSLLPPEVMDKIEGIKCYSSGVEPNLDNKYNKTIKKYKLLILSFEVLK